MSNMGLVSGSLSEEGSHKNAISVKRPYAISWPLLEIFSRYVLDDWPIAGPGPMQLTIPGHNSSQHCRDIRSTIKLRCSFSLARQEYEIKKRKEKINSEAQGSSQFIISRS